MSNSLLWLLLSLSLLGGLALSYRYRRGAMTAVEFLTAPAPAWTIAAAATAMAQSLLWFFDTPTRDLVYFHDDVDGQAASVLCVLLVVRVSLIRHGVSSRPTELKMSLRLALALIAGFGGVLLIDAMDEFLFDDALDFNDEADGKALLFLTFLGLSWLLSRGVSKKPRTPAGAWLKELGIGLGVGLFAGFAVHELLWLVSHSHQLFSGMPSFMVRMSFDLMIVASVVVLSNRRVRRVQDKRDQANHEGANKLIEALRRRANNHRRIAYVALTLTFCTLAFAMFIFVFAGSITAKESGERLVARSSAIGAELTQALANALEPLPAEHRSALNQKLLSVSPRQWGETIFNLIVEKGLRDSYDTQLLFALDRIVERYERDGGRVSDIEVVKESKETPQDKDGSHTADEFLASVPALLTRLTVAALAVFLTQILVSLYRYSSRMAAFCDGRADALSAAQVQESGAFSTFVGSFSAENVHFGQMPAGPLEQVVQITSQLVKSGWKAPE